MISCLYCTPEHLFLPLRRALLPTLSLCRRTLPSFCTPASLFSSSSAGIPPYFVSLPADISLFCTPVSLLSSSSAGIPSHLVSSSAGIFLFCTPAHLFSLFSVGISPYFVSLPADIPLFLHAGFSTFFLFGGHFSLLCLFAGGHFPLFTRRFLYFLPLQRAFLLTLSLCRRTFPFFARRLICFPPFRRAFLPTFFSSPADTSLFLHAGFSTFFLFGGHFSLLCLFAGGHFPLFTRRFLYFLPLQRAFLLTLSLCRRTFPFFARRLICFPPFRRAFLPTFSLLRRILPSFLHAGFSTFFLFGGHSFPLCLFFGGYFSFFARRLTCFLLLRRAFLPTLSLCRRTFPSFCTPAFLLSSFSAGISPYFVSLPADISLFLRRFLYFLPLQRAFLLTLSLCRRTFPFFARRLICFPPFRRAFLPTFSLLRRILPSFCTPASLLSSSSAGIPSHFVSSSAGIFLFLHAGSPVFFFFDGHFSLLFLFAGGHFPLFTRRLLYFLPLQRAFLLTLSLCRRTFPSFCTPASLLSSSSAGIPSHFVSSSVGIFFFCTPASCFLPLRRAFLPTLSLCGGHSPSFCTPVSLFSPSSTGIPPYFSLFSGGHFLLFARRLICFLPLQRAFLPTFTIFQRILPSFCTPASLLSSSWTGISPYFFSSPADISLFCTPAELAQAQYARLTPFYPVRREKTAVLQPLRAICFREKQRTLCIATDSLKVLLIEILAANNNQKGMALS